MNILITQTLNLKRSTKIAILLFVDIIISSISVWITFNLISNKIVKFFGIDIKIYILLSLTFILVQIITKTYLSLSRYFDFSSIYKIIKNFLIYSLILFFYKFFIYNGALIPISNLIIYLIIFFLLMLLKNSLLYNFYNYLYDKNNLKKKKIVLYGFNERTFKYIKNLRNYNFSIDGVINENLQFYKTTNYNFPLINIKELNSFIKKNKITDILISKKNNYENKIYFYRKFLEHNIRVVFLDDVYNNLNLDNKLNSFRPNFDEIVNENLKNFKNKDPIFKDIKKRVILVVGGAGSIGSVLIEKLITYKPSKIIIVDKDEFNIFNLKKKINENKKIIFRLVDSCQYEFLDKIFKDYKPDYVFNAAAYKHVNIVEENSTYSLYNNIKTSLNICKLAIKYKIKKCLLISTDKAVNPSNTMGFSKRICEKIYLEYSKNKLDIFFLIVRFGNVVGSKGSVIPYFQDLIEKRLPLPLTDKKATRYLMSINEACELIIKISIFGNNAGIYLLDMGKPINIFDMTYKLIKFNGLSVKDKKNPNGDIVIKFTGLKKGEKLHEKLSYNKFLKKTKHNKILICNEKKVITINMFEIEKFLQNLLKFKNLRNLKNKIRKIGN
jgi:FlaA1/EpsC-like NDP-sugar epimerase